MRRVPRVRTHTCPLFSSFPFWVCPEPVLVVVFLRYLKGTKATRSETKVAVSAGAHPIRGPRMWAEEQFKMAIDRNEGLAFGLEEMLMVRKHENSAPCFQVFLVCVCPEPVLANRRSVFSSRDAESNVCGLFRSMLAISMDETR